MSIFNNCDLLVNMLKQRKTSMRGRIGKIAGVVYTLVSLFFILLAISIIFGIIISLITGTNYDGGDVGDSVFLMVMMLFFFSSLVLSLSKVISYFFPEFRAKLPLSKLKETSSPYEVIQYISTPDENMVIDTVHDLSPRAYKFEIARKTELSKMKIHRIVLRLTERGIVTIEKIGKHSRVSLADWLVPNITPQGQLPRRTPLQGNQQPGRTPPQEHQPGYPPEQLPPKTRWLTLVIVLNWLGIIILGIIGAILLLFYPPLGLVLLVIAGLLFWLVKELPKFNNNARIVQLVLSAVGALGNILGGNYIGLLLGALIIYALVIDKPTVALFKPTYQYQKDLPMQELNIK